MIDLHIHSIFSDGSFTPEQLVKRGREIGLSAMSLTDHDSTGGIDTFLTACEEDGEIVGVPGIEISADVKRGTMHILGYFINHKNKDLQDMLQSMCDGRDIRNKEILAKLKTLGMDLTWDEVASFAGGEVVGRPHIAQALVARGYVNSMRATFNLYLAKGMPAYVDRFRLSPADSMSVILKAGGVPVLSHPFTLNLDGSSLEKYIGELADMGLKGIEAYYSEYSREQEQEYLRLAEIFKLAVTGGSDFHGAINPGIRMGAGFGSLNVPDELVEELRQRCAGVDG